MSGEYSWIYTHGVYDFSIFGNTPITFPIVWDKSKIPGYAVRVSVPDYHGLTALVVFSSFASRFFEPQIGGLGVTPSGQGGNGVFRIDHDEKFQQTTHLQYQPWRNGPWIGFNWRYDSGLTAGAAPFAEDTSTPVDLTGITANQQLEGGLYCGNQVPTLSNPFDELRTVTIWLHAHQNSRRQERKMMITIHPGSIPEAYLTLLWATTMFSMATSTSGALRLSAINVTNKVRTLQFPFNLHWNPLCYSAYNYR